MKILEKQLISKILENSLIKKDRLVSNIDSNILTIHFNDLNINEHIRIVDNENFYTVSYIVDYYNKEKADILSKHYFIKEEKRTLIDKEWVYDRKSKYTIVEKEFIFDDIVEYFSIIVNKMFKEFNEVNSNSERLTTQISVIKRKKFEIDELNKEINNLKPSIEEKMLNKANKIWDINDVIMLKKDNYSVSLKQNKKYFINKFKIKYENDLTPNIIFEVGRVNSDGTLNTNIISSDNYIQDSYISKFNKVESKVKEKFARTDADMYKYRFHIYYKENYEIINNKVIKYTKNGIYGTEYSGNFLNGISNLLENNNEKQIDLDNVVEYQYKNNTYLYFCLDKKSPKFSATKKNIDDLIELIKKDSPFLIKMPKDYEDGSFLNNGCKNHSDFLKSKILEQSKLLNK